MCVYVCGVLGYMCFSNVQSHEAQRTRGPGSWQPVWRECKGVPLGLACLRDCLPQVSPSMCLVCSVVYWELTRHLSARSWYADRTWPPTKEVVPEELGGLVNQRLTAMVFRYET